MNEYVIVDKKTILYIERLLRHGYYRNPPSDLTLQDAGYMAQTLRDIEDLMNKYIRECLSEGEE